MQQPAIESRGTAGKFVNVKIARNPPATTKAWGLENI